MVEAGRHLLSFYPQTPPSSGKAGFCLFCSLPLLRVFVGWGKEGVGCPTPLGPFTVAGDGSQTPQGGLGNSRVKGRSKGLWPKAQPRAS